MAILTFKLPDFSTSKDITWQVDMDSGKLEELGCDMIIGRNLVQVLNIVIDFEYQVIRWDDVSIPMNRTKITKKKRKELHDIFVVVTSKNRCEEILKLLLQFEDLFDGTLGEFHTNPVHLN